MNLRFFLFLSPCCLYHSSSCNGRCSDSLCSLCVVSQGISIRRGEITGGCCLYFLPRNSWGWGGPLVDPPCCCLHLTTADYTCCCLHSWGKFTWTWIGGSRVRKSLYKILYKIHSSPDLPSLPPSSQSHSVYFYLLPALFITGHLVGIST